MDLQVVDLWLNGFASALSPHNLLFLILGTVVGMVVGALPAVGPNFGVALMLPMTFAMPADTAIIFLAAVHAATAYGDSIASILINVPGGGGSIPACWDGHPLTRQGKGGMALALSAIASLLGGIAGWLSLVFLSPLLIAAALRIGPPEVFMIGVLALSLLAVAVQGQTVKGLIMACLGLLISFIGQDSITGFYRFTFGIGILEDGIDIIPIVVGVFALGQIFGMAQEGGTIGRLSEVGGGALEAFREVSRRTMTIVRAGLVGIWVGVLPALGIGSASVVSYMMEKRASKDPDSFGKGNPAGLISPEVAKGACVVGDLVPTFTLGIPGSPTTAILMAALVVHGLRPGVDFFKGQLPYTVFAGILLAQFAFFLIGIFTAKYWAKVVLLPNAMLVPLIGVLAAVGAFADHNRIEVMYLVALFGFLGYIMNQNHYPAAPLVLGLVLGDLIEANYNRSMLLYKGSLSWVFTRPVALTLLIITVLSLGWPYLETAYRALRGRPAETITR